MVLFDANMLLLLLDPSVDVPLDPETGKPLVLAKERVEHLLDSLDKSRTTVVIPTPALSEVLVHAGDAAPEYLNIMSGSARFRIAPFDMRSAVEVAAMTASAIGSGNKKGGSTAPWQKVKIDRQIVAIALVEGVKTIYADDGGLRKFAVHAGINVTSSWELPPPPECREPSLFDPRQK